MSRRFQEETRRNGKKRQTTGEIEEREEDSLSLDVGREPLYFRLRFALLSDREAEEIERGRIQKVAGPIVLKWVDQLLADRRERVRQLEHLRKRLSQAFGYLDGLVRDARQQATPPPQKLVCPMCRRPYVGASGISPRGIVYTHADRTECRG